MFEPLIIAWWYVSDLMIHTSSNCSHFNCISFYQKTRQKPRFASLLHSTVPVLNVLTILSLSDCNCDNLWRPDSLCCTFWWTKFLISFCRNNDLPCKQYCKITQDEYPVTPPCCLESFLSSLNTSQASVFLTHELVTNNSRNLLSTDFFFVKIFMYLCVCVQLLELVVDRYGKPKHFCQVCNYPAYDEYNLILHNQSEEHNRKVSAACDHYYTFLTTLCITKILSPFWFVFKLVEKHAQQEEDCESRKTNSRIGSLLREKQEAISFNRGKQEEAA